MRADLVRAANRWSGNALIILLASLATWLLVEILRDGAEVLLLLVALLVALTALCLIVWHRRSDSPLTAKRKAWLFPGACSVIAVAMSLSGLNGSSSAMVSWAIDGVAPSAGLIAGQAKLMRSDEWMVHTPWLLSQAKQVHPFSSRNPSVGGQHAPLVCNLPAAHWSICFRPELWIFFAGLKPETAFAVFWNFKWWSLLCGTYVLLLVITRGESLLSAGGALILLWTSTIQWWFSSPTLMPDMVGLWCFGLAAGFGAIVHQKRGMRVLLSAAYAFCGLGFLFCCYPPFQIPLLTLFAPLLVALVYDHNTVRRWRGIAVATGFVIISLVVFSWQLRDTISTIGALVYPGRRFSTGGGVPWTSIVHGFLTLGISELHFPKNFENVVAASSFLNALPLLVCVHLARWRRGPKHDVIQSVLLAFAAFAALFALCGFPRFFAQVSLWSYATTERLSVSLALVTVLALCRYLSSRVDPDPTRVGRWSAAIGVLIFGVVLVAANRELHNFVAPAALVAIWLFYSVVGVFLVAKFRLACLVMILFPIAFLNAGINPLSRGIPGYGMTSISPTVTELRRAFPQTRWIVIGASLRATVISSLIKATGATVFSGVTAVPNQEMLDRLDPKHLNTPVYWRYANVRFLPGTSAAAVPEFELEQTTIYSVRLPLTDEWLRLAGVDGVVVPDAPDLTIPQPYREVALVSGVRFWVRSPVAE